MPRRSTNAQPVHPSRRTVALCYVRKSWTRDEKDLISPERQRANISRVCEARGWTPEWYEDVEGHRSGMHEKNRPGWLALKARLTDPDVTALVANDLARLHRKGWRVGDLLDFVEQLGVALIVADPLRQLDFSTPIGKTIAQLSAIFDEWYAADISLRRKADIAHRKSKGVTVGLPPFGTKRDKKTGFLIPSDEGAWLLPDGTWAAGKVGENPPTDSSVWRGYFSCAERILTLYAGQHKTLRVCQQLQDDGWAFRDRQGQPSPVEIADIRRVVANWPEYGGYVSAKRARERHPSDYPPEEIIAKLNPDRAVFPVDLLARVARSRQERAIGKHPDTGVNARAHTYPLGGIVHCASCERFAERNRNPKLRSLLSGYHGTFYRHRPGAACGCSAKSVPRAVIEGQFERLIQTLDIRPDAAELMTQFALAVHTVGQDEQTVEKQKTEAMALCRRRIQAAVDLYGDGRITREEYHRRVELNEKELASWQARTTEREQLALELGMCIDAIHRVTLMWTMSSDEDKQGMARHLFDHLVYDLDRGQIVDFRLKPWAEQFLTARVEMFATEDNSGYNEDNPVTPARFELAF
ncbi:MAG: recombinase family protein [Anaerolineae bacterium]